MFRSSTTISVRLPLADTVFSRALGPAIMAGLLVVSPAHAQQAPQIGASVFSFSAGLFCAPAQTERRDAPDTMAGWVHVPVEPVEMVIQGQVAVAQLRTGFGVTYRLQPGLFGSVDFSVSHPPIPPSNVTEQRWQGYLDPGREDTVFFQFDIEEELQPGLWTISAAMQGETLFSVEFTVVAPESAPHLTDLCRAPVLMSMLSPTGPAAAG